MTPVQRLLVLFGATVVPSPVVDPGESKMKLASYRDAAVTATTAETAAETAAAEAQAQAVAARNDAVAKNAAFAAVIKTKGGRVVDGTTIYESADGTAWSQATVPGIDADVDDSGPVAPTV